MAGTVGAGAACAETGERTLVRRAELINMPLAIEDDLRSLARILLIITSSNLTALQNMLIILIHQIYILCNLFANLAIVGFQIL
jgi:hypothetical protein